MAPDVFVALQVARERVQQVYKVWEVGGPPTCVIEATSPSTANEDQGERRLRSAEMGVVELVLFDPLSEYRQPRLQGYRLVEGEYEPWPDAGLANGGLRWASRALGLELHALPGDDKLRLWDPRRGAYLPTTAEAWARAEQAEQVRRRADAEAAARRALEEVARLRAELERRAGR